MKNRKRIISAAIFAMTIAPSAFAGNEGARGGGAFVCKVQKGTQVELVSAEMQDLWEAANANEPKLTLEDLAGDEKQISYDRIAILKRFNQRLYNYVKANLDLVIAKREIIAVKIEEIGDNKRRFSKENCNEGEPVFAQAAVYLPHDRLVYSEQVWNLLTPMHRAALNVHEAIYKFTREHLSDQDSVRARLITGYLFARVTDEDLAPIIPPARFNPDSPDSYESKFADLLDRFKDGTTPMEEYIIPGKWVQSERKCSIFGEFLEWKDHIPAERLTFYSKEGNLLSLASFGLNGYKVDGTGTCCGHHRAGGFVPIGKKDGETFARFMEGDFGIDDVVDWGRILIRSDENGDWILRVDREKCTKWGFLGLWCKQSRIDEHYAVLYCPKP